MCLEQRLDMPVQTTTQLNLSSDRAISLFSEGAKLYDLPAEHTGSRLKVVSPFGEILVEADDPGARVTVSAPDRAKLYALQETIDHALEEIGASESLNWSEAEAGSLPGNMSVARVEWCKRISPSYFRVRLSDPDLERFARDGLHFRLLFGPFGYAGEWPFIAETGRTVWPGGASAWHRPVYTTRYVDPKAGILEFDVFVHEGGKVSQWCESVQAGEEVALMGPGGDWYPEAGWLGLVGDETALPAIARILEAASPATRGVAVIMTSHEDDIQALRCPDGMAIKWLRREGAETLLDALDRLDLPETDRLVWFAGEKSEAAAARERMTALGLNKHECRATAYWIR